MHNMKLSSFEVVKMLGEGGFSKVYLAKCKKNCSLVYKNQLVAVKVINKQKHGSISEIQTLQIVKNKMFVSQMLGCFQNDTNVFLILQYEQNGSLLDLINRSNKIPIDCAQTIITEVVIGLQYLHVQNILHGDLKPENILLDNNLRAHVADFGLSLTMDPIHEFFEKWGTDGYQSPEQLLGNVSWDYRMDYFNVGVIFLFMIIGKHPFGQSKKEIENNVINLRFIKPKLDYKAAYSFVRKTLCIKVHRFNYTNINRHDFIAPMVDKVTSTYDAKHAVFLMDDASIEPFYDNKKMFKPIPGVPFDGSFWEGEEPDEEIEQSAARRTEANDATMKEQEEEHDSYSLVSYPNETAVMEILQRQLNKSSETKGCTITKIGLNEYSIRCNICDRSIKAAKQQRGKKKSKLNWSVQPFVRHLARHTKKNN